jgi:DNA mismatch endonuclease (patch repair protein)
MMANRCVSHVELQLRKSLWAAGVRGYRVRSALPGRPDLVFTKARLAVFVHGCFWHRCPECAPRPPTANAEFWRDKFAANLERDRRAITELTELGWRVVVVWEHELRRDQEMAASRVMKELDRPVQPGG